MAALDPLDLVELEDTPGNAYGLALAKSLFAAKSLVPDEDADVRGKYGQFKAAVEGAGDFLRVKLAVDRSAPELHRLRWELLTDPETGQPLATSERILFSRFGSSGDWRPVRLRAKTELRHWSRSRTRATSTSSGLRRSTSRARSARAREHLKGIKVDGRRAGRRRPADPRPADRRAPRRRRHPLPRLPRRAHGEGACCCTCRPRTEPPWRPRRRARPAHRRARRAPAAGRAGLVRERRLGADVDPGASIAAGQLVPLAPALAEAGVHAVLAMQGKISMETVKTAMPVFFAELLKDGQIDRAFAVARGKVRERPDSWMPALFLRLKGGRIWYEPGFGEGEETSKVGGARRRGATGGEPFTPIVGPGLGENVYGSLRDVSPRACRDAGFPLAEHQRSELQQVAQFVQFNQDGRHRARDVHGRSCAGRSCGDTLALGGGEGAELSRAHGAGGPAQPRRGPRRPVPAPGAARREALRHRQPRQPARGGARAEGKTPETFCLQLAARRSRPRRQGADGSRATSPRARGADAASRSSSTSSATSEDDDSLVLTEDDYFDYLISLIQYKPRIPGVVGEQTTSTSLLFLGFQLTDWSFRVLYRLIMSQEGSSKLKQLTHVAVQIDPEEDTLINPRAARRYLEDYFGSSGPETVHDLLGQRRRVPEGADNQLETIEEAVPVEATVDAGDW